MSIIKRLVSLESVAAQARTAAIRFPFTLGSAAAGVGAAMYLIQKQPSELPADPARIILVCALGLPLFTALSTFAERFRGSGGLRYGVPALGLIPLILYFFSLPDAFAETGQYLVRSLLLLAAFHYLAAFAAYMGRGETGAFWRFNKSVFLRFVETGLYSSVLFAGLAIAIAAINHLFDAGIDEKVYGHLFVLMAGLFQTWVFVAGIPTRDETQIHRPAYPAGLKIFAQYILLTLAIVYFVILIAYEFKIVVTWDWPRGWVSQLVLWYSVVGILALLLLYPLRDEPDQRWIRIFDRWFFRGLVPLIVMLFIAIYIRIADYGITVSRYLVLGMAVGLTAVTVYFIFSRARDIRAIPVVICVLALLSSYGPWSAFSVSERSQQNRLESYLTEAGILTDGAFHTPATTPSRETLEELTSIVNYLCNWHGPQAYRRWFSDSVITHWEGIHRQDWRREVAERMHFELTYARPRMYLDSTRFSISVSPELDAGVNTAGYDYLVLCDRFRDTQFPRVAVLGGDSCRAEYNREINAVDVRIQMPEVHDSEFVSIPLTSLLENITPGENELVPDPAMRAIDASGAHFDYRLVVRELGGQVVDDRNEVNVFRAWLLLRRK